MKNSRSLLGLLALSASFPLAALAQSYTWVNSGGGQWSNSSNWIGGAPVSGTNALLTFTSAAAFFNPAVNDVADPFTVHGITFRSLTGEFNTSGGTLNLANNGPTAAYIEHLSAQTASIQNNITVGNALQVSGNGTVLRFGGTVFNSDATDLLTIARGSSTYTAFDTGLVNSGTFIVSSGTTGLWNSLSNSGAVHVDSTLIFSGGALYDFEEGGSFTGGASSRISFGGGQVNFNGASNYTATSSGTVELNGSTLAGSANFTLDVSGGFFDWRSGEIGGTASQSASILLNTGQLEGPATKSISRALTFSGGSLTWNGGAIDLGTTGNLTLSSNTLQATGLAGNIAASGSANQLSLVASSFSKISGTGTVIEIQPLVSADALSVISVSEGGIKFVRGGTFSSVFNANEGAYFEFTGTSNLQGIGSITGGVDGLRISAGQFNVNSNSFSIYSGMRLEDGATLGGTASNYSISTSLFRWNGGTIAGPSGSYVGISGPSVLSGTTTKSIVSRHVSLSGTWTGGNIELKDATLSIGGLTVQNDGTIFLSGTAGTLFVGSNFLKNTTTGTTTINATVTAGGLVSAASGKILMTNGGTATTGGFNTFSGGTIEFGGGTFELNNSGGFGNIAGPPAGGNFLISGGRVNVNLTGANVNQNSTLTLMTGGTLGGSASNYTISGNRMNWTGGVITGGAGSFVSISTPTIISGTAVKTVDTRTVGLSGTWTGGDINLKDATLSIGGLTVQNDGTIFLTGTAGTLFVGSNLTKNTTTGTTTIGATVTAAGVVVASSGKILMTNGGTATSGGFNTYAGGTIEFGGGTFEMNNSAGFGSFLGSPVGGNFLISAGRVNVNTSSANVNQNSTLTLATGGTLGGSASNYTISGSSVQWTGGVITGGAGSIVSINTPTVISGTAPKTIDTRTVGLSGTWTGGNIHLKDANLSIGGLTVQSDGMLTRSGSNGTLFVGSNLLKNTTTGTTTIDATVVAAGVVSAASGKILMTNGGTATSGGFNTFAGGTIEFGGGTFELNNSTGFGSVLGSPVGGNFLISGGRVNVNVSSANINQNSTLTLASGGTLGGAASFFSISGSSLQWTGGMITGGANSQVIVNAPTVISGTAVKSIVNRNVALSGTWTGGDITVENASLSVGNLTVQSDAKITGTGTAAFLNNGTLRKNSTTGTTTIASTFINNGLVQVDAGTLLLAANATNQSSIVVNNGGTLNVASHLSGFGPLTVNQGGSLVGTGTIGSYVAMSGTLAAGNSPGKMTFESDVDFTGSSVFFLEIAALEDDQTGGVAGTDWDLLAFSGFGSLSFESGSLLTLDFSGIPDPNTPNAFWDGTTDRSWLIADLASGTLDYADLVISNANWETGTFSLANQGNDLYLQFTAVPEPGTGSLLILTAAGFLLRRRRD